MDPTQSQRRLRFPQGSNYFRQRLAFALLSAKPVKITEIRSATTELSVGLCPWEVSFIHLLDALSNGSKFKINETGTEVSLVPGVLTGGTVTHKCDPSRPLSYYLEPVLLLAPFCKKPLYLTLKGKVQGGNGYNSIYKLKHAALPIMEKFGIEVDLQVKSRSFASSEIIFKCTVRKQLLTLRSQYNSVPGKVKKVRGLAYGFRVSPQMLSRIITSAKGSLRPFLQDIFVTNDPIKCSSKTPGFGLILYAETTKGVVYSADEFISREDNPSSSSGDRGPLHVHTPNLDQVQGQASESFNLFPDEERIEDDSGIPLKRSRKDDDGEKPGVMAKVTKKSSPGLTSPEELGHRVVNFLLREIQTESRVDSVYQFLVLGLMTLSPRDVSSVVLGEITPFTVQFLRDLKTFFGVTFRVEKYKETEGNVDEEEEGFEEEEEEKKLYKLSCLGTGYINLNKTTM